MNSRVAHTALVVLAVLLGACGDNAERAKPATQTAAKVNKEEITVHQINALLQQQRVVKPELAGEASRQALERLIDQELRLEKAQEIKVHRDPRVVQAIEAARRDIVARAYIDKISESAAAPTPAEIKAYFDANPALFKERRIYQLQELAVDASSEQLAVLRVRLKAAKNIDEFTEYLRANNIKYAANQAVRAAEQLPLSALPALAAMRDGQAMLNATPNGAQVIVLTGSRAQPIDEGAASKAIEQFLLNERKRSIVADDLKALRASARIAYSGKFAASAPGARSLDAKPATDSLGVHGGTATAGSPALADAPPRSASGADAAAIVKGLGLK